MLTLHGSKETCAHRFSFASQCKQTTIRIESLKKKNRIRSIYTDRCYLMETFREHRVRNALVEIPKLRNTNVALSFNQFDNII